MSFLTDLFEGNFGNLGTDISHAPSSLIAHPDELIETLAGASLIAAPFAVPAIGGALGVGDAALGAGAIDAGLGADAVLGSDVALGTDAALGADAALGGDVALGADALSGAGSLFDITGPGLGMDVLADPNIVGFGASFDPGLASTTAADLGGGVNAPEAVDPTLSNITGGATTAPTPPASVPTAGTTPAGFASTDAEQLGAATGTAPSTAATTGGGITGTLNSILANPFTKIAAAVAPLALTLGMGQGGLPSGAQQLQQQANALSQQGQADLASAKAGQLNAGQTAALGKMQTDLLNQWRQTLANQGVQDPTKDGRWPMIQATIDSQVTAATQTMIQQNITNALAETGQASQALTSIAQIQLQQDQNFTNNLVGATKSLGLAAGLSSGTKITIGS